MNSYFLFLDDNLNSLVHYCHSFSGYIDRMITMRNLPMSILLPACACRDHLKALALGMAMFAAGSGLAVAQTAPPSNFQGAYVGAHLGGGWGKAGAASTSGIVGGAHIGANAQFGNVVAGVEADVSASSLGHRGFTDKFNQGTTGSLRGRLGYAFDRVLVYGTAGGAMTSTEWKNLAGKTSKTQSGFVYGAGAEVKMTPNVSLRGELLHYDFSREIYTSTLGPVQVKPSTNVLRAGVGYQF
jgi:outer membrane immunogenic protein